VPPPSKASIPPVVNGNGTNGHALPAMPGIEDSSLFDLIASIGVNRVLDTAVAVERALHA
jgi:hypothetical protein